MIVYLGLRHFYIHYFPQKNSDDNLVLTYHNRIWDFSPQLSNYGFRTNIPFSVALQENPTIKLVAIDPERFASYSKPFFSFCRSWTDFIEKEYPHAWYNQLPDHFSCEEFAAEFNAFAGKLGLEAIWGAGTSKLVAKMAAHRGAGVVPPEKTRQFLASIPINRLLNDPIQPQLKQLGLHKLGDLYQIPAKDLQRQLGHTGHNLYLLSQGSDIKPFTPDQLEEVVQWECNFADHPDIQNIISQPILQNYLRQATQHLSAQLQAVGKLAGVIQLSYCPTPGCHPAVSAVKRLASPSQRAETFYQQTVSSLPQQAAFLALKAKQLQKIKPKQLNIFEPAEINRSAAAKLRETMPIQFRTPTPSRRERVLQEWEVNHL